MALDGLEQVALNVAPRGQKVHVVWHTDDFIITGASKEVLVRQLNRKIRGWANYYRHVVAKKTFAHVDNQVFLALLSWINHRHPNKSCSWKRKRYFRRHGRCNWVFSVAIHDKQGNAHHLDLLQAASIPIVRHVKIRADATPYDPAYIDYFESRKASRRVNPFAWSGATAEGLVRHTVDAT